METPLRKFIVTISEVHTTQIEVEAHDEDDARDMVAHDFAEGNSTESLEWDYSHTLPEEDWDVKEAVE